MKIYIAAVLTAISGNAQADWDGSSTKETGLWASDDTGDKSVA